VVNRADFLMSALRPLMLQQRRQSGHFAFVPEAHPDSFEQGSNSVDWLGFQRDSVHAVALGARLPDLKKVANVTAEQVFQIASENMNNAYWLQLAKRVNTLLAQNDVDGIPHNRVRAVPAEMRWARPLPQEIQANLSPGSLSERLCRAAARAQQTANQSSRRQQAR